MKDDPLITYRRKPASIDSEALEQFAQTLRQSVAGGKSFHCRIGNDEDLRDLNARFRGKDESTDVLSFPADADVHDDGPTYLGDIAVSLGRARAQARELGHSTDDELRILLLHGVLHLLGYDHETDAGQMKRAESRWRKLFDLPGGLIERAAQRAEFAGPVR